MMTNFIKHHKVIKWITIMTVAVVSVIVFYRIYPFSDLILHADFIKNHLENKSPLPQNFLYYLVVKTGALGSPSNLMISTIAILTIAVLGKFLLTVNYFANNYQSADNKTFQYLLAIVLVFSTAIYLPQYFIAHRYYLGSFTLNVWHNSTTIAVMPFAIMLFQQTMHQIKEGFSNKRLLIIILLILVNALIKPSYLFVYIGALPVTLLLLKPKVKTFVVQMYPVVVALLAVLILKLLIYNNEDTASVEIDPLLVYKYHHPTLNNWQIVIILSLSIILGYVFPIIASRSNTIKTFNIDVIFSSVALMGGIAMFLLFTETGERWWHGNFFWQIVISGYILFMVMARESFNLLNIFKLKKLNILQIALLLHLLFGMVYILRLILRGAYI